MYFKTAADVRPLEEDLADIGLTVSRTASAPEALDEAKAKKSSKKRRR